MEQHQKYLADIIKFEKTRDANDKHEWLLDYVEAVRIANYLRGHGYKVTCYRVNIIGLKGSGYVGVLKQYLPKRP